MKYYSLDNILSKNCQYNMIIGERSNGKTYASLKYGLENYCKTGKQMAIIRRWQDDFRGKRGATMFNALISNGVVSKLTNNEYNDIYYYAGRWFLCKYEDDKRIMDQKPFAYGFAISAQEHDKSTSYPDITTVIFDEFLTRTAYLPDEFVLLMNVLSTIIRDRDDVKIFMLGNTVNKYCPYFDEMGLHHIKAMEQGDIDVYTYGDSKLRVAVEYSDGISKKGKPSDIYFAFNNPKLSMITDGNWEINIYPHLPVKYLPKDVRFTYYIIFDKDILQCEIVTTEDSIFTYIHRKTTKIKKPDKDLVFMREFDRRPNYRRKLTKPIDKIGMKIYEFFKKEKVFYQDNEIGEIVRNYLLWCNSDKL